MLSFPTRSVALALALSVGATTPAVIDLRSPAHAQAAQSLPKSLTVLGKALVLKDSHGGPSADYVVEYVPPGETFNDWTLLFASRFYPGAGLDPMASAVTTANRISARKQSGDPFANSTVFKAQDGQSVAVDFLLSDGDIVEHNVFRYFKTPKGLVSFQIARRIYANKAKEGDVQAFIDTIKTRRSDILNELMRADLPVSEGAR